MCLPSAIAFQFTAPVRELGVANREVGIHPPARQLTTQAVRY
jgi:hypothetical protein